MSLPESTNGSTKPVARQSGLRAHVSYGSKPEKLKTSKCFSICSKSGLH
jgi:hypothetical protein